MAFVFYPNVLHADAASAMLALKAALKTAGWVCLDSGDGRDNTLTPRQYGNGADILLNATVGGSGYDAGSIGNIYAWFRLRAPDEGRELVIQHGSSNPGSDGWRVKDSALGGFGGGTPSADTPPTATDEQWILGDGSMEGRPFFGNSGSQRVDMAIGGEAEGYALYALSRASGTRAYTGGLLLDALEGADADDEDPAVLLVASASNVWGQNGVLMRGENLWPPNGGNPRVWGWQRTVNDGRMAQHQIPFPTAVSTDEILLGANPYDGNFDVFGPVYWARTTRLESGQEERGAPRGGVKGRSRIFAFVGTPNVLDMDTGNSRSVVAQGFGRYWLVWDGSTTPTDLGGSSTDQTLLDHLTFANARFSPYAQAGTDVTAPAITNFSPTPGTQIKPQQAVAFDVTDETDVAAVFLSTKFPTGAHEVIWDGDSFSRLYETSERTPITGGYHYVIRRTGGWPMAPTFRATAIDTAGNR